MATAQYPANWQAGGDFNPQDHLMQLKGRDYLNVQARMQWFIRDQRALIVAGLATMPYVIRTEIVEHNPERQYAHFLTYVRDVLGNEATMYGSETGKDFADYAEKASTKSLGRALAVLGYGIAAAQEMDEGERVVDTPQERRQRRPVPTQQPPRTDQRTPHAPDAPDMPAHSLRLADQHQDEPPQTPHNAPLAMPKTKPAPAVTLPDCAAYADAHGLTRDEYQRAVGKYGTQKPAYLLAALEEYVEKTQARPAKTPA